MARSVEEIAYQTLEEYRTHRKPTVSLNKTVHKARRILETGRLLCLSEALYQVEGSPNKETERGQVYTVTCNVGAGPKSCTCRASEFGNKGMCSHWLAVTAYGIAVRKRREELEEERRLMLIRANELSEELTELGVA